MVFFGVEGWNHAAFLDALATHQVKIGTAGRHLRAVTHLDITTDNIDQALEEIAKVLASS